VSENQIEERLPDGSKRVTWKMPATHKDGAPFEIVIIVKPDGTTHVNGVAVGQTEPETPPGTGTLS
jgi:hypothetical protein